MQVIEIDVSTGVQVEREFTAEEVAAIAATQANYAEEQRAGMRLSFAQLLIGLVAEGWITESDGDGWLAGTLPAPVLALIGTLPQAQQFAAKARAIRPSEVLRSDPLVSLLAAYQGKTPEELDAFFANYAVV